MAEFGLIQGLSRPLNQNLIGDLRYNEQADKQAREEAIARAKLYADDTKYQQGMNPFDDAKVKEFAYAKMKEMAQFKRDHPNYEYIPEEKAAMSRLSDSIKNNEHVIRGMAFKQQEDALLKDMQEAAANPQFHDIEAYQEQYKKFQNYRNTGHFEGRTDAGIAPPVYNKPREFIDLIATFQKIGNSTKNGKIIKPKNGNIGEYYKEMDPETLNVLTDAAIQNHGRQIDVETRKLGLNTPEQKRQWVATQIKSGFDDEYHFGDANAARERGFRERQLQVAQDKAQGKVKSFASPFDETFRYAAGTIPEDHIKKVWGSKPVSPITGNNGVKVDLSNHDIDFRGGRFVKRNGIPFFLGDIRISPEEARQKGIITVEDEDDLKNQDISDRGMRISPEFVGKATWEKYNKGDKKGLDVVVSYKMPVNLKDPNSKLKFDAFAEPDKFVSPIEGSGSGTFIEIDGQQIKVGSRVKDEQTGKVGILQADGSIK